MVYNFGCVCLYVCQTKIFESLDIASSYLHIWCISTEYKSSSYMQVNVTGAKKLKIPIPTMLTSLTHNR